MPWAGWSMASQYPFQSHENLLATFMGRLTG
jgi:hypothetical protein